MKKDDLCTEGSVPCIHYGELFTRYGPIITNVVSTTNVEAKRVSQTGDILFPTSDVTPNGLARCSAIADAGVILGGDIAVLRPIESINPFYLSYAINFEKDQLLNRVTGALIKHISAKSLKSVIVSIPPMDEQIKFIDFVRQVDKSKLMFQQMISRYDELVKSRFIEMFGDVVNNTKCWKSGKLQDVSEVTSSKRVFSSDFVESGIPFYRGSEISELSEDGYTKPEYYISRELYEELSKYTGKPKRGDILLPSICSKGELWVVDTDDPFYIKDGRVLWIKTDLSQMNSTFLRYMLRKYIVENFKTMASGSTFAEMKIFILKGIPVVIPPLDLQNQFADFVKQVDKSKFYFLR